MDFKWIYFYETLNEEMITKWLVSLKVKFLTKFKERGDLILLQKEEVKHITNHINIIEDTKLIMIPLLEEINHLLVWTN